MQEPKVHDFRIMETGKGFYVQEYISFTHLDRVKTGWCHYKTRHLTKEAISLLTVELGAFDTSPVNEAYEPAFLFKTIEQATRVIEIIIESRTKFPIYHPYTPKDNEQKETDTN